MPRPTMCILQKHIQTEHIQMHIRVAARGPEERSKGGVGAGVSLRGLMIIMCLELSGERERKRERERENQHNSSSHLGIKNSQFHASEKMGQSLIITKILI